jgi:hypothetical protein
MGTGELAVSRGASDCIDPDGLEEVDASGRLYVGAGKVLTWPSMNRTIGPIVREQIRLRLRRSKSP